MRRFVTLIFAISTMTLMAQTHINIIVGSTSFTATLADSKTGEAYAALLPLTITMNELNGNEKYHYLSSSLPTDSYQPGTIHAGDLMLYGNNCVVLFYKTFNSGYSYTRIGALNDHSGLSDALGTGNVSVRFEKGETTDLGEVQNDKIPSTKVLRDGQLFIEHHGKTFTILGEKLE